MYYSLKLGGGGDAPLPPLQCPSYGGKLPPPPEVLNKLDTSTNGRAVKFETRERGRSQTLYHRLVILHVGVL